jgi:hypothetical protein
MGSALPPSGALSPQQLRAAYDVNLLGQDGSGQIIAIVAAYDNPDLVDSNFVPNTSQVNASSVPYSTSDLHAFDYYYGVPDFGHVGGPTFTKLDQNGGTNYPATEAPGAGNWEGEEALDVEWAHVMAPGASIVLVEANSASYQDLMAAVSTARNIAGVSVISMSFEESYSALMQSGVDPANYEQDLTTPGGHTGITFVASSGDAGAPSGFPAESANVVAVGGTTLTLNNNNYGSETGWAGSGGGISSTVPQPGYQQGLVIYNGGSVVGAGGMRSVPDVAFDADPNTGVAVYDSYNGGSSPWEELGGTSVGAPCWAGLIALANQIRVSAGLATLDGPSQTLPNLYSLPAGDFHDVTSGSSAGSPQYAAAAGYDLVTGLGTPVANLLVPDLSGTVTLSPSLPADTVNIPYNQAVTARGGLGPITLVVSNVQNAIPGLNVPASGNGSLTISGTPTAAGTETFTVTATDSQGQTASTIYNVTVNGPVTLSAVTPAGEQLDVACDQTISASGGTGPITLVVSSVQDFIPGIVMPSGGTDSISITGTPAALGTETFTVTATDSLGATTSLNYSITVYPAVTIGPAALPADTVNVPYDQTLTGGGGAGSVTLAVSNIQYAIPGLSVQNSGSNSLSISGTPTAAGTEIVTVTATDAAGNTDSTNYSITVHGAITLAPLTLANVQVNAACNQTLTASGGTGAISVAISNIQNPIAGLDLSIGGSGNSISVSGTPTVAGTETFTVTATDSVGAMTSATYSITVTAAVTIGPATLPADTVNVAYNQTLAASGGVGSITLAVSNIQNALAGLIVPASGNGSLTISGTPTAVGTETFTVTATDSLGDTTASTYSITVQGAITLSLPADTVGVAYNQTLTASSGTGNVTFTVSGIQNAVAGLVVPAGGSNSLTISGTPTATGTETFSVTATDSQGNSISTNYTITVHGGVRLGLAALPADTLSVGYAQTLTASGGTGNITLVVSNIINPVVGLVLPALGSNSLSISGTPTITGTETFTVTAIDSVGAATSGTYSITVNALPVLSGIEGGGLIFVQDAPAETITAAVVVADPAQNILASAAVWISGNYQNGQDVLSFANTGSITGSWNAATGILTLAGSDTLANYQAALRSVQYQDTSVNPSKLARTVSFKVNDGLADSNAVTRQIAIATSPVVTSISPSTGTSTGGTVVTITGTGFTGATVVDFGSAAGTNIVVNSATQITVTSPAGAGLANVTVVTPGGTSAIVPADQFTYVVNSSVVGMAPDGSWWMASSNGSSFTNQYWGGWNGTLAWKYVQTGDFAGNGKKDIVGMAPDGSWWVALSSGTGFVNQCWGGWNGTLGWKYVHVADVTGNGRADIVGMAPDGSWWVALSTGTGFVNQYWGSWNGSVNWQIVQMADVTGSGRSDIVGMTPDGSWWVGLSTGTSFSNQYWGGWNPSAGWHAVQFADVTGDGKADIVGMTSSGTWWVAVSTGTGFVNQYWGGWNPSAGWQDVEVADVTGDGKADIVGMTSSGGWWVAISTGTGFVNQYWGNWNPAAGWQDVQLVDVNGDGKADLVGMTNTGSWWVGLSTGSSFVNQYWGGWNSSFTWQYVAAGAFSG